MSLTWYDSTAAREDSRVCGSSVTSPAASLSARGPTQGSWQANMAARSRSFGISGVERQAVRCGVTDNLLFQVFLSSSSSTNQCYGAVPICPGTGSLECQDASCASSSSSVPSCHKTTFDKFPFHHFSGSHARGPAGPTLSTVLSPFSTA